MQMLRVLVVVMLVGIGCSEAGANPLLLQITGKGAMQSLSMPNEIVKAISKVAPGFMPWKMKDYLPRVQEQFPGAQPSYAPFAVITDINHDGVNDLVVDGSTRKKSMTIVVLSSKQGYKAQIVESYTRMKPEDVQDVDENGKISSGLNRFLSFEDAQRSSDKSYAFTVNYAQIETPDGGLSDVAVVTYYFRKGKFISETSEG